VFADLLSSRLASFRKLSDEQADQLRRHYDLLVRWNKVLNLTAIRTLEEAVERHYCESIFAAAHLPQGRLSVADLGSGAGFPGIPIAVVRPECSVTLIESHQRKAVFLQEAARELPNVRVIGKRAEDVSERFDLVVSRAVKYSDIAEDLKRLGESVELLTGEVGLSDLPGFDWQAPLRLPWGQHRFLWIGRLVSRETVVSRETDKNLES
jgi:16S rRNA (guanine527-N7)-methyltransferase